MGYPILSSWVLILLLILTSQDAIVPSAAQVKPTPEVRDPCPNRCHQHRFRAESECSRGFRLRAGCQVSDCPRVGTRKLGWACASPTGAPTPPPAASDFTNLTFVRGTTMTDSRTEPATDGSGVNYDISYDMTVTADGIVSLDAIANSTSIECSTDGSVRIRLADDVPAADLNSMYPEGAILVISRELFGECNLAEEAEIPDETDDDRDFREAASRPGLLTDAFLIIESVSGTPRDAIISGTTTSYFALFDSADISITPSVAPPASATSRELMPFSSRQVNVEFDSDLLSIGPLALTLTGNGEFRGGFVSFTASWDLTSANIEFKFINLWELSFSLDARLSASVGGRGRRVVELLSIPLYGLPPINFFSNLDLGRFSLPTFKLGLFFEIPLIVRVEAMIQRELGNVATATYTTTSTEVTLFVRGPYLSLDVGAETRTLAPSSRTFDYMPSFSADAETEVSFTAFVGIRPQFAAYIPIFSARVSLEAGVQVEGTWLPGANNAFIPLPGGGVPKFGRCDECHDVQVCGTGVIQNAGIFVDARLDLRVEVWRFNITIPVIRTSLAAITLPGNPSVTVDIAKGCFIEPIGDDGPLNFIAAAGMCEACPPEMPTYNPTRQECEEECPDPDRPFFNIASGECEACPPEIPTFNEELSICEANCPGGTRAGNDVPFFGSFELGSPSGVFTFQREHFVVRDRMEVFYEGAVIHDTGCTGGFESINLPYSGNATNVVVKVTPNCAGTTGTAWRFSVSCPT